MSTQTIAEIEAELAGLPDLWSVDGSKAQEALYTKKRSLEVRIHQGKNFSNRLASLDADLAPRRAWRDHLLEWRPLFAAELQACSTGAPDRRRGLEISLQAIDRSFNFSYEAFPEHLPLFELMKAANYLPPPSEPWNMWRAGFGSLPQVEQRIVELEHQRAIVQQQLDAALGEPISV
jgi:hypothetical protein